MIDRIQWATGAAAGGAGVATANANSPDVHGKIFAVHVDYVDSPPGTTDFTLVDANDPGSESIVSLANQATDIKIYPRRLLETNDGTDLTYDGSNKVYGPYIVHGPLTATIAQANNGDSVTVTVWVER